jgi:hypothetical protein
MFGCKGQSSGNENLYSGFKQKQNRGHWELKKYCAHPFYIEIVKQHSTHVKKVPLSV